MARAILGHEDHWPWVYELSTDWIDGRIDKLHADVAVDLHGMPAHGMQTLLENAIRGVIEDDEQDADAIMRGRPQGLARVHRAAVADQSHDRSV